MSFSTTVAAIDSVLQSLFGEISITIHPSVSGGWTDLLIPNAISRDPTLEDDYNPLAPQGVSNLILFFNPATLPPLLPTQMLPAHGDTATASNGVRYNLSRVKPDNEGGYVLYLRRISPGAP